MAGLIIILSVFGKENNFTEILIYKKDSPSSSVTFCASTIQNLPQSILEHFYDHLNIPDAYWQSSSPWLLVYYFNCDKYGNPCDLKNFLKVCKNKETNGF